VLINVNPSPVVNLTNDTTICTGTSIQLTATGGGTYEWSPSANLNNTAIPNPLSSPASDITYKVKVTAANTCSTQDSVKISVRQYPQFSASPMQTVCAGESVTIEASGGDVYQWSPSANFPNANSPTITFVPTASETYNVAISESVCRHDTTIRVTVSVNPLPVIVAQKSNDINCTVPEAKITASGAQTYVWSPSAGLSDASVANPFATPDTSTTYQVIGTNEFGCTSSATVVVNVDKSGAPRFVVPNAFTPDNDGRNDCFGIQRWGNAHIKQFSIYNRWGKLIFQASDPSQCWDGTWKGKLQDAGGYIYIISATTLCGEITRKGMLLLIR
jgi:gliding motility-associated-like protein